LSIIAILAIISFPIYTQYFIRQNRIEAEIALEKLAANLEQYNTLNNTYKNATLSELSMASEVAKDAYHLVIAETSDTEFLINAIPSAEQAEKDASCLILSLNSKGEKGITGPGQVNDCW
ncbi:MAG: hypothetical protein JO131_08535, partial [Gammaproteobacteria bacterium]|nr:hypothetical protein [Gammaproteobacteria bacterium]